MNKGRRRELTKLKHLKRLKRLGLDPACGFWCYKHQTKPCSCYMCSPNHAKVNGLKKQQQKELRRELEENQVP
jgi:hypothetical protein